MDSKTKKKIVKGLKVIGDQIDNLGQPDVPQYPNPDEYEEGEARQLVTDIQDAIDNAEVFMNDLQQLIGDAEELAELEEAEDEA